MRQGSAQIQDWHIPTDLGPAVFENIINNSKPTLPKNEENTPLQKETKKPPMSEQGGILNNGMIDKLLPLVGKIGNGGLDMSSVLELLDKSGQGFGALGKLLPIITPLLQNGGLGNLFNAKKKSTGDIIEYNTINLDH